MNPLRHRPELCVIITLLCCVLTGCGGGTKKVPPPVVQNANPAPPAPGGPAAPGSAVGGNVGGMAKSTSAKPGAAPETDASELPGPDDFVLSTDQIVTEIENPQPKPPPVPFEVSPIPKGVDSSNLVFATLDTTQPGNSNSANFPPPSVSNPVTPMASTGNSDNVKPMGQIPGPTVSASQASGSPDALSLPKGFIPVAGSQIDAETGLPQRIHGDRDLVEMVLIPPGVFLRGADVADATVAPKHTVLLEQPYYIDTLEVSVARYNAFREFFRKTEGRKLDASANHDGNPDFPAVGIKFFDAKFYAKWAGKEIPTEAQWERAARGDKGYDFPWGDGRPIFQLPRVPGQLDPVGIFPGDRSPYGIYDMAGNAREWCLDLYQADVYPKEISLGAGTVRNPAGPKSAPGIKQQVVRGGGNDWAVWHRSAIPQNETAPDMGFRCVLNLSPTAKAKSDKPDKNNPKKTDDKKKSGPKL